MESVALFKLIHLLVFVYWLGADLGVFYTSRSVADPSLDPRTRLAIARIMMWLDQIPRLCLILAVPSGLLLASTMRYLSLPPGLLWAIWLIALLWLAVVIELHWGQRPQWRAALTRIDYSLRWMVLVLSVGVAVYSLGGGRWLGNHDWLAWKLLIFGGALACGLLVRRLITPFASALRQLAEGSQTADTDRAIATALGRCRVPVFMIWAALLINAALGLHLL